MKLGHLNAVLTGLNAPRLGNPLACMAAVVFKGKGVRSQQAEGKVRRLNVGEYSTKYIMF